MHRLQRNTRRWWVLRALAAAAPALVLVLATSCDDEPTSPRVEPPTRIPLPQFNTIWGEPNPDSLPPGSFEITLFVDDIATGVFQKRQFATYSGKTLVKFTAWDDVEKVHRVSGSKIDISPRGQSVAGGCYSYTVVDFRKTGNQYGGGWAGLCNAPLVTTLVLEGTGTAHRTPGYPWNGLQQCGGVGQPTCFEYGKWHKVRLAPTSQKLEIVVDSSSVMSGSTVRFTARRTDGGAFTVQSWTWKPLTRVSNAGTTTASTYGPSASGCSVGPICNAMLTNTETSSEPTAAPQRGIMYVRALVNGIVETARAEVTVSRGQLRLQASPQDPWEGDSVTFSPSTTDGQAIRVLSWQWMPDTAPGRTVACAPSETTNDCKTPVFERGVMYVTAEVGQIVLANAIRSSARATSDVSLSSGGITTQRAAVRVVPKADELTLTANPSSVKHGEPVEFKVRSKSGRRVTVQSWSWVGTTPPAVGDPLTASGANCGTGDECKMEVYESGVMTVAATIHNLPELRQASATVSVTDCPTLGDPRMDSPPFRKGLLDAIKRSRTGAFHELGGAVYYRPSDGARILLEIPSTTPNSCMYTPGTPPPVPDGYVRDDADWHTHPHKPGETVTGCAQPGIKAGAIVKAGQGPSQRVADGQPGGDWAVQVAANRSGYLIDGSGDIWRWNYPLGPAWTPQNTQWKRDGKSACFVHGGNYPPLPGLP